MTDIIDLTPKLVAKQNKDAAKSFVNKMDCKGQAFFELMSLMAQLQVKKDDK